MERKNIQIKETATYFPNNVVTNEYYIEHFKVQGRDVSNFLNVIGREERYIIDTQDENTLSMGIKAAQLVLEKAQLEGKDIDIIVFSTQVPEHTLPTHAIFVHNAIKARSNTVVFDMNVNCAGMTVAVETVSRYMMTNPRMERALVIGSDANSLISNPQQEITYANFSDGAAAVILEKTDENTGFIDAVYEVDSSYKFNIIYPQVGFAKTIGQQSYIDFVPFDVVTVISGACKMIEDLLTTNGLTIENVDAFCFSQFALSNIKKIQSNFDIKEEKIIYVGDKFGYTTSSSPFVSLHEGIKSERIKRGDTVLFWTIGAGHEMIAMLFKY